MKFILIMLVLISAALLAISGVLFYDDKKSQARHDERIFNELGDKEPQEITSGEMTILLKMSNRTSQTTFESFLEAGAIKWILTQNDPRDYTSLNIVSRFDSEQTIFFQTSIRSNSRLASDLEAWARQLDVEVSHIPVEPVPPSQGFFSFVTSGHGILFIIFIIIVGGVFVWSVLFGPFSILKMFSKSGAELAQNEKTTFDDVAGVDEAKEDVIEIIDLFLAHARKKELSGTEILPPVPKGVLLVGPPGTGKTLIARAAANRAKVPFFHINGASFVEIFVGVGPRKVRRLFGEAKKNSPSIIFIDELDAVGAKRSQGVAMSGDKEYSNTVNALLSEMDGFDKKTPVLVIAATNKIEMIDEALLRPGRFTRHIFVDRADKNGRIDILRIHTKDLARQGLLSDNISLENISSQISGFSGDDIRNLVNEAHMLAIRRWKDRELQPQMKRVEMDDFEKAIDKVAFGSENKSRIISESEKTRIAAHEVGHLITAYELEQESDDKVYKISIVQRGRTGGHVRPLPSNNIFSTRKQLVSRLAFYAGGLAAEEICFDGDISNSASYDLSVMTQVAYDMVVKWGMAPENLGLLNFEKNLLENYSRYSPATAELIDEQMRQLTSNAKQTARSIILAKKGKFDILVRKILEAETLQGEELRKILEQ